MEFQSPPTSRTDEETELREAFEKRVEYTRDLRMASDLLKWKWMGLPLSVVPLEIKYHILEDDTEKARIEFDAYSEYLENLHNPEQGYVFSAHGHRHEQTTQHFAELKLGHGNVRYVVVWIEKDAEVGA
jgi:hypothetical protein